MLTNKARRTHKCAASLDVEPVEKPIFSDSILEGRLQYTIHGPEQEVIILDDSVYGVVEPTVLHEVKPLANVRFYVEFHR
jgi:hypothetical protein